MSFGLPSPATLASVIDCACIYLLDLLGTPPEASYCGGAAEVVSGLLGRSSRGTASEICPAYRYPRREWRWQLLPPRQVLPFTDSASDLRSRLTINRRITATNYHEIDMNCKRKEGVEGREEKG
jgi:hypothetical protein